MSTFKEIRGQLIRSLATDPSPLLKGQMWYNSTSGTLKGAKNIGGAFASAPAMNVNRFNCRGMIGSKTTALVMGGGDPTGAFLGTSEEYNGSAWTAGGALPAVTTSPGGGGTSASAFSSGGNSPTDTRLDTSNNYDGSTWTASGTMVTASGQGAGNGTQTAGIHVGGRPTTPSAYLTTTQEYDGSNWTTGGVYPTGVGYNLNIGTQTAALCGNGLNAGTTLNDNTNEYDGSSWTAGGTINSIRYAAGGFGIQTSAIMGGGGPGAVAGIATESYDGSSWTTAASQATQAEYRMGSGTSNTSGLIMGGNNSPVGTGPNNATNVTEEWTDPTTGAVTVTTS